MKVTAGETADTYEAVHPVVRTIEETGQKAIYCSKVHTTHFEGMTGDESHPLIEWLVAHATRPEFTCRVQLEARHADGVGQPPRHAQRDQRLSGHASPHAAADLGADRSSLGRRFRQCLKA